MLTEPAPLAGTSFTEANPLRVGNAAPTLTLFDAAGAPAVLADLWSEGPILLTFLRHFG